MHFLTIVLLPQEIPLEDSALFAAIAHRIEAYNIHVEGPMRKEYFEARAIQRLAARYWVPATNLPMIAAKLRQDLGVGCGVDERGLYYLTDDNPEGKYDYWDFNHIEEHGWLVRDTPRDLLPSAVVTPDGLWHDTGAEKWG